jgi:hypothetical protein
LGVEIVRLRFAFARLGSREQNLSVKCRFIPQLPCCT